MKTTKYFTETRKRPDRANIRDSWIEQAVRAPVKRLTQADGRVRTWAGIEEQEGRYLRVVLLADGETVHNAFFDRDFKP